MNANEISFQVLPSGKLGAAKVVKVTVGRSKVAFTSKRYGSLAENFARCEGWLQAQVENTMVAQNQRLAALAALDLRGLSGETLDRIHAEALAEDARITEGIAAIRRHHVAEAYAAEQAMLKDHEDALAEDAQRQMAACEDVFDGPAPMHSGSVEAGESCECGHVWKHAGPALRVAIGGGSMPVCNECAQAAVLSGAGVFADGAVACFGCGKSTAGVGGTRVVGRPLCDSCYTVAVFHDDGCTTPEGVTL